MFGCSVEIVVKEGDMTLTSKRQVEDEIDIPTCLAGCLESTTSRHLQLLADTVSLLDERVSMLTPEIAAAETQFVLAAEQVLEAWHRFDEEFRSSHP
jgi:hypothetical protein